MKSDFKFAIISFDVTIILTKILGRRNHSKIVAILPMLVGSVMWNELALIFL